MAKLSSGDEYQNDQDPSQLYRDIFEPAERARYIRTCRLTSDISTKEFHHYSLDIASLPAPFFELSQYEIVSTHCLSLAQP